MRTERREFSLGIFVAQAMRMLVAIVFFWRDAKGPPPDVVEARPEPAPPAIVPIVPEPSLDLAQTRRRRGVAKENMRLKRSILDHLDDNTKIIGRMKTFFPAEYAIYSKLGAALIPHDATAHRMELVTEPVSSWFHEARPSFGAIVTGIPNDETKDSDDRILPRLMHFMKVAERKSIHGYMYRKGRNDIQPLASTSDLYVFTLYFDERDWALLFPKKSREEWRMCRFFERAFAFELPVELTEDGHARPLKIKRDRVLRFGKERIALKRWDYPYTKEYAAQLKRPLSPEAAILREVGLCLRGFEAATASMIQVRATKNNVSTLINVDVEDTPDFFADREDVIVDGIKKRIFHIVRAHERVGSKGVKIHFRGLRQFTWNGYDIEISVPWRDHFDTSSFDVKLHDNQEAPDSIGVDKVAAFLLANQRARAGAMVGKPGKWTELPRPEAPT